MPLNYIQGQLHLVQTSAQYNLLEMARELEQPFYLYDLEGIRLRTDFFINSFRRNIRVYYAMKANNQKDVMKLMLKMGCGVDVVSGGELKQAIDLGFAPNKIIFSGVGKTRHEIELAVKSQIAQINVESPQELSRIGEIARSLSLPANVAWRINPDVKAETHPYITTGFRDNKFGMDRSFLPQLKQIMKENNELNLVGLTMHIGSQIREIEPFVEAIHRVKTLFSSLKSEGFPLQSLDIGGGLGINYDKSDVAGDNQQIHNYALAIDKELEDFEGDVLLEPGRILVGSFGWLFAEVQYIKSTPWKNFAITNTGMHHLMRPALYQAHHRIQPLVAKENVRSQSYDIVGPICESADVLGYDRYLPSLEQGDWLVIEDAGAYGQVMSSGYNSHQGPKEIAL